MINTAKEKLLTLSEAATLLPIARHDRHGRELSPSRNRVFRLIQSHQLEGICINKQWFTSREAIQRMLDRSQTETQARLDTTRNHEV